MLFQMPDKIPTSLDRFIIASVAQVVMGVGGIHSGVMSPDRSLARISREVEGPMLTRVEQRSRYGGAAEVGRW